MIKCHEVCTSKTTFFASTNFESIRQAERQNVIKYVQTWLTTKHGIHLEILIWIQRKENNTWHASYTEQRQCFTKIFIFILRNPFPLGAFSNGHNRTNDSYTVQCFLLAFFPFFHFCV